MQFQYQQSLELLMSFNPDLSLMFFKSSKTIKSHDCASKIEQQRDQAQKQEQMVEVSG